MGEGTVKRILVVDDTEDVRGFVVTALEMEGFVALEASDAESGFNQTIKLKPDLILIDIVMAGPSGLDLIERLRKEKSKRLPPMIACSSFPQFEKEALARGAVAFLAKPFHASHLVQVVRQYLDKAALDQQVLNNARKGTLELRADAAHASESMLRQAMTVWPAHRERARWGATWLASYWGFGRVVILFIQGEHLVVEASSDELEFPADSQEDESIPFCRDIIETGASIVVPNAARYVPADPRSARKPIGLFAGRPIRAPHNVTIGAICLIDEAPRSIATEDFEVLELFAHYGSGVIGQIIDGGVTAPVFESRDLLGPSCFTDLLDIEVHRARKEDASLEIAVVSFVADPLHGGLPENVRQVLRAGHCAAAQLMSGRLAIFVTRPLRAEATQHLLEVLKQLRDVAGIRKVGVVAVRGSELPTVASRELLNTAEQLATRHPVERHRVIERIVIKLEGLGADLYSPQPPG